MGTLCKMEKIKIDCNDLPISQTCILSAMEHIKHLKKNVMVILKFMSALQHKKKKNMVIFHHCKISPLVKWGELPKYLEVNTCMSNSCLM